MINVRQYSKEVYGHNFSFSFLLVSSFSCSTARLATYVAAGHTRNDGIPGSCDEIASSQLACTMRCTISGALVHCVARRCITRPFQRAVLCAVQEEVPSPFCIVNLSRSDSAPPIDCRPSTAAAPSITHSAAASPLQYRLGQLHQPWQRAPCLEALTPVAEQRLLAASCTVSFTRCTCRRTVSFTRPLLQLLAAPSPSFIYPRRGPLVDCVLSHSLLLSRCRCPE